MLKASCLRISREASRKLLKSLQAARLVEFSSSHVRLTRFLLDDFASLGVRSVGSWAACPKGEVPAPGSYGVTGETPRSSKVSAHSPISSGGQAHTPGAAGAPKASTSQESSGPLLEEFLAFFNLFESAISDWIVGTGEETHSSPALPCGASPAATPKGLPDGMPKGFPDGIPSYGNVYPASWVSAELDAILKRLQATSGQ